MVRAHHSDAFVAMLGAVSLQIGAAHRLRSRRKDCECLRLEILHDRIIDGSGCGPTLRDLDRTGCLASHRGVVRGHEIRRPRQSWQWDLLETGAPKIPARAPMSVYEAMRIGRVPYVTS